MAAGVGDISIGFIAETSKFSVGVKKVNSELSQLGGPLGKISGLMGSLATPAGVAGVAMGVMATEVALVTGAVTAMIGEIHRLDDIGDTAENIGITTNGLIHLRFAAERAGASAEELDKGVAKMVRTLGEARSGAKESQAAFGKLGLDFNKVSEMDPEQAFRQIADAINRIPNPAERAAAAVDIFGRGGQQLLGTLSLGSSGLERMANAANDFGLSMSDIDMQRVGDLDNAFKNVSDSLEGMLRVLTVEFLPELEKGVNILVGFLDLLRENAQAVKGLIYLASTFAGLPGMAVSLIFGADVASSLEERGRAINDKARARKGVAAGTNIELPGASGAVKEKRMRDPELLRALEFGTPGFEQAARNRMNQQDNPLQKLAREQLEVARESRDELRKLNRPVESMRDI